MPYRMEKSAQRSLSCHVLTIIPEEVICAGAVLAAVSRPLDVHLRLYKPVSDWLEMLPLDSTGLNM